MQFASKSPLDGIAPSFGPGPGVLATIVEHMATDSERTRFTNADGLVLHGDLAVPDGATLGVVIAHPHPQFGGNRFDNVVAALFDALTGAGVAALRFDFRGVGSSEGSFADGEGDVGDVMAALDHLSERDASLALAVAGYSFGADVSLALDDPRPRSVFAVAPPLTIGGQERFETRADPRPVWIATGTGDQFRTAEAAATVVERWPNATVHPIAGADHFFGSGLAELAELVVSWSAEIAAG